METRIWHHWLEKREGASERRWSALRLPNSGTRVMDHICHHWSRRGLRELRGVCNLGLLSAPNSYVPLGHWKPPPLSSLAVLV